MQRLYFQDFMPNNVCFGCGNQHPDGLKIKSFWDGEQSICLWQSQDYYRGWKGLLNGGILATVVDCHCMGTAMAAAYRAENRELDSLPVYRYATGTLSVKYLLPTPTDTEIEIKTQILEIKGKKVVMKCEIFANNLKTAEADVVALRVFDSSQKQENNVFAENL